MHFLIGSTWNILDKAENDPNLIFPEQPWLCGGITIVMSVKMILIAFSERKLSHLQILVGIVVEKILFVSFGVDMVFPIVRGANRLKPKLLQNDISLSL